MTPLPNAGKVIIIITMKQWKKVAPWVAGGAAGLLVASSLVGSAYFKIGRASCRERVYVLV